MLRIQVLNISQQTYPHINEWVIVDGSKSEEESRALRQFVDELLSKNSPSNASNALQNVKNVVFIPKATKSSNNNDKIGRLRNLANQNVATDSDIIINFDDDDYYMPTHVAHVVDTFNNNTAFNSFDVVGCANVYIYDFRWRVLVQADLAPKYNNTSNNCIAYTRTYAMQNEFAEDVDVDEESEFLHMPPNSLDSRMPIKQLDPALTTVHFVHGTNTSRNKDRVILSPFYNVAYCAKNTAKQVGDLVPAKVLAMYQEAQGLNALNGQTVIDTTNVVDATSLSNIPPKVNKPKIIYFCGMWSIRWDPRDRSLGGSEQAVVNLSREWAKQGFDVTVYTELELDGANSNKNNKNSQSITIDQVKYASTDLFDPSILACDDTLILWRNFGVVPFFSTDIYKNMKGQGNGIKNKGINILIDLHDNDPKAYELICKNLYKFPNAKIMFKSRFHQEQYEFFTKTKLAPKNAIVIMNGIKTDLFSTNLTHLPKANLTHFRNPYRFVYASCYLRGLENILIHLWPVLYATEPRAELHVYYGMKYMDKGHRERIEKLLMQSKGVCDHGRQSDIIVAREKQMSNFHLYITDNMEEIDCISIRESLVAGAIPLLLDAGLFKERDGVKIAVGTNMPDTVKIITDLMKNPAKCEELREELRRSKTIVGWGDISREWMTQGRRAGPPRH